MTHYFSSLFLCYLEKKLIKHYINIVMLYHLNKISMILNFELSAITSCLIE